MSSFHSCFSSPCYSFCSSIPPLNVPCQSLPFILFSSLSLSVSLSLSLSLSLRTFFLSFLSFLFPHLTFCSLHIPAPDSSFLPFPFSLVTPLLIPPPITPTSHCYNSSFISSFALNNKVITGNKELQTDPSARGLIPLVAFV